MAVPVLRILVGAALLLLGCQLYWLFVAGVGFAVAMELVTRFAGIESTALMLLIALAAGIVGALLAVWLQKAAIGLAGFFAGGYAVLALLDLAGTRVPALSWILALVGAVIGVVVTLVVFDWALIILSSLAGAGTIIQALDLTRPMTVAGFLVLLTIGIAVQASLLTREKRRGTESRRGTR
jgi:hypothetical protein